MSSEWVTVHYRIPRRTANAKSVNGEKIDKADSETDSDVPVGDDYAFIGKPLGPGADDMEEEAQKEVKTEKKRSRPRKISNQDEAATLLTASGLGELISTTTSKFPGEASRALQAIGDYFSGLFCGVWL